MTKPNPDMESTYSHTVSYTSNMRPQVHPMCEAMSAASRHGLDVMASPAAGESPASPEPAQAQRRSLPNAVMQTTPTNCFSACVATILGIPITEVPLACDGAWWDWDAFQEWLAGRGLQAVEMTFENGGTLYPVRRAVRCILTGPSPRECSTGRHAIVGDYIGLDGFELLHDPHESQMWLDGEPTHAVFFVHLTPPAAGESSPISPEVTQAHGLTPPATPSAAVGASGPVAGDTVPPEIGKQYVCRNGDVTEEMGAGLRIQTYPFRARVNGVIRTWMRDGKHDESKSSEYDLIAEYHEPEPSPPAESPDDWVTQDRVPARPGIDQRAYLYGTNALSDWEDSECVKWHDMPMHGQSNNCGGIFQLRCRRKDLPTMPVVNNSVERGKLPPVDASKLPSIPQKVLDDRSEWREQAAAWSELFGWCCRNGFDCADNRYNGLNGLGTLAQWILDLKSAAKPNNQNATPPVVPKTRTVTLREYTTDGEVYWTTNPNVRTTGRTCECEVPE